MTTNATPRRTPRAADAVRTVSIARALALLTPEAATVRLTPVWTDRTGVPRMGTVVMITDDHGRPVGNLAAHKVARALLRQQFSRMDWTRQHRYDVRTGRLYPLATAAGPAELVSGGAR